MDNQAEISLVLVEGGNNHAVFVKKTKEGMRVLQFNWKTRLVYTVLIVTKFNKNCSRCNQNWRCTRWHPLVYYNKYMYPMKTHRERNTLNTYLRDRASGKSIKIGFKLRTSHSQKNLWYSYLKKSVFKLPKIKHNDYIKA